MSTFKILVVEDDVWFGKLIEHHLSLNEDYEVDLVHSVKELNNKLNGSYNVITLDYSLPDGRGDVLLKQIKSNFPLTDVVIVSGQEELDVAVDLLRHGAYDYIVKNDDAKQKLWNTITKIKENQSLRQEVQDLREQVSTHYDFSKTIIGTSPGIKKVFKMLGRAVTNKINVSIKGETGTGKEVIAKAIHYNSAQKKHPFVGINVSAIPRELIESELFGHEKGAFTGASARRLGKFEMAKNGTLFLDEIGEMDTFMQAKLLRVLQERELTRIGGSETVKVECRIICATHKNLLEEVMELKQVHYFMEVLLVVQV